MPNPGLCTEDEIRVLVHAFYTRVRADDRIGPVFNAHVDDWDQHLSKLCDFWSSVLLGSARYSGTPMPIHGRLPGLDAGLFERWLELFAQTAAGQPNQALAANAVAASQRIARSLWFGYQTVNAPAGLPTDLPSRATR